jgi:hypothetical protein
VLDEVVGWPDVLGVVEDEEDAAGVVAVAGVVVEVALEGRVAREPMSLSTTGAFANGSFAFAARCVDCATW